MKKTNNKQRLFEVMSKVNKSFILNENNTATMNQLSDKQVFDTIMNSNNKLKTVDELKDYIYNLNDEYIHYIINLTPEKNWDEMIAKIIKYRKGNINSEIAYSLLIHSSDPLSLIPYINIETIKKMSPEDIKKIANTHFDLRPDKKEKFMSLFAQN